MATIVSIEPRPSSDQLPTHRVPLNAQWPWTNLPGWASFHVQERSGLRKKDITTADAFDKLSGLWNVPWSFAGDIRDQEVLVLTIESGHVSASGPTAQLKSRQLEGTVQEFVSVIQFLVENGGGTTRKVNLKDSASVAEVLHQSRLHPSQKRWLALPTLLLRKWLSRDSYLPVEVSRRLNELRNVFHPPNFRIALFGDCTRAVGSNVKSVVAAEQRFAEIWDRGFFLTFTSQALMESPGGLKRLWSLLEQLGYEALTAPEGVQRCSPWVSLHTYWLLNPDRSVSGSPLHESLNERFNFAAVSAFNAIHEPEVRPPIKVVSLSSLKQAPISSIDPLESNEHTILNPVAIPFQEIRSRCQTLNRSHGPSPLPDGEEIGIIADISNQLKRLFWKFKKCVVIVSDCEAASRGLPAMDVELMTMTECLDKLGESLEYSPQPTE